MAATPPVFVCRFLLAALVTGVPIGLLIAWLSTPPQSVNQQQVSAMRREAAEALALASRSLDWCFKRIGQPHCQLLYAAGDTASMTCRTKHTSIRWDRF